jgi:hypothetical protein
MHSVISSGIVIIYVGVEERREEYEMLRIEDK